MNETEQRHYSLDELCALTETPKRTVRFYIQQQLVDRPIGQRKGAYYLEKHLLQLLEIKKWQQAGVSLERIRDILRHEADETPPVKPQQPGSIEIWSHLAISDGVQLTIEAQRSGLTPEQVRALVKAVMSAYEDIKNDK